MYGSHKREHSKSSWIQRKPGFKIFQLLFSLSIARGECQTVTRIFDLSTKANLLALTIFKERVRFPGGSFMQRLNIYLKQVKTPEKLVFGHYQYKYGFCLATTLSINK